jgi:hypothetical protein
VIHALVRVRVRHSLGDLRRVSKKVGVQETDGSVADVAPLRYVRKIRARK